MHHWIVKQEPDAYSFSHFATDKHTEWTGVRNFQARNFLRAMEVNDKVLYYHSGDDRAVVGTATVSRAAAPDPTVDDEDRKGGWVSVELQAGKLLKRPVPLAELKADKKLEAILLVRHSRLSVSPVTSDEYEHILGLANRPAA